MCMLRWLVAFEITTNNQDVFAAMITLFGSLILGNRGYNVCKACDWDSFIEMFYLVWDCL